MPVLCPRCKQHKYTPLNEPLSNATVVALTVHPFPSTSITDGKSFICWPCGQDEQLLDNTGAELPGRDHWPITLPKGRPCHP